MPINDKHPQYTQFHRRWTKIELALGDEDDVKDAGTIILPKTAGMLKNDVSGKDYERFKDRARFVEITSQSQTGIVGLVFEKDPIGVSDKPITKSGQTNLELARETIRNLSGKGRYVLVVDAPSDGGEPYIVKYTAESLINWKVSEDNPADLSLAVFEEDTPDTDDVYSHRTKKTYRRYLTLPSGAVELSRWEQINSIDVQIAEPRILPVPFMPIVIPGSIDTTPNCDTIPLMPVARCALAYYRKSATYEQALHLTGQPTPWVSGIDEGQYEAILAQGLGSSSLLYLGENGAMGFLEPSTETAPIANAMEEELRQAATYAVRLAQADSTPESGRAIAMRAATQHASIYSMADSASIGITRAQEMRNQWAGQPSDEDFSLRTEFDEEYAAEAMIAALDSAINSGNSPRAPMFEAIRRSGLSELTDEQMQAAIEAERPAGAVGFLRAPT